MLDIVVNSRPEDCAQAYVIARSYSDTRQRNETGRNGTKRDETGRNGTTIA